MELLWPFTFLLFLSLVSTFCPCDDTSGCDLLCCCDPSCSETDKAFFKCQSSTTTTAAISETCIASNVFSRISTHNGISYTTNGSSYCFQSSSTSLKSSNSVNFDPDESNSISDTNPNSTFISNSFSHFTQSNNSRLLSNDPIYYVSNISRSLLLPGSLRGTCVRDSVLYLRNTSATCSRAITSGVCQAGKNTDATLYEDLSLLSNHRASSITSITVSTACEDTTGGFIACSTPSVVGGNCNNVLKRVVLDITHDDFGLVAATLRLTIGSVTLAESASLETVVKFNPSSTDYPNASPRYQRYRVTEEVIFKDATGTAISTLTPFLGITGCTPTTGPVSFPTTTISSCTKTLPTDALSTNCTTELSLFTNLPAAVGKYSNSDLAISDEWIAIPWNVPDITSCSSVPQTVILTINHRKTGSRLHPENELISVDVSVASIDLQTLENQDLLRSGRVDFYLMVRWLNQNVAGGIEDNLISRIGAGFPQYSLPVQALAVLVVLFILVSGVIFYNEVGRPER